MFIRGAIFFNKKQVFSDGTSKEKLLVLLNNPEENDPHLFVQTTSQRKDKPLSPGCIEKRGLFFIPGSSTFFEKDTWLELYSFQEFDSSIVRHDSDFVFEGDLADRLMAAVIDCLLRSMGKDITRFQMRLLRQPIQDPLQKLKNHFDRRRT